MAISRRGLIRLAPALIRPGLLMPISTKHVGYLNRIIAKYGDRPEPFMHIDPKLYESIMRNVSYASGIPVRILHMK